MSTLAAHSGFDLPPADPRRELARWSLSVAIIVALHAGLAALMVARWMTPPMPQGDAPAVLLDMAPPPAAPPAPPAPTPPSIAEPESAAPVPTPDPTPEPLPPISEPVVETMVAPEPPTPDAVQEPPMVEAPPVPAPKDAVVLPPPPRKVAAKPKPRAEPKPRVVERKPSRQIQADTRADIRQEARRPPANASGAQTTASVPSQSSGSSAASKAQWQSQLVAYLQRNLRYPAGSGNGGSAAVSFAMDRHGRVLSARLVRSAGSTELDAAALATLRGTLPPAPPDVAGATFAFTIPVRFNRS